MPYKQIDELPEDIRQQLPEHAQQIFFAAFNAAQDNGMRECFKSPVVGSKKF